MEESIFTGFFIVFKIYLFNLIIFPFQGFYSFYNIFISLNFSCCAGLLSMYKISFPKYSLDLVYSSRLVILLKIAWFCFNFSYFSGLTKDIFIKYFSFFPVLYKQIYRKYFVWLHTTLFSPFLPAFYKQLSKKYFVCKHTTLVIPYFSGFLNRLLQSYGNI